MMTDDDYAVIQVHDFGHQVYSFKLISDPVAELAVSDELVDEGFPNKWPLPWRLEKSRKEWKVTYYKIVT